MVLTLRPAISGVLAGIVLVAGACSPLFPSTPGDGLGDAPAPVLDASERAGFADGDVAITMVEVWRSREPDAGQHPPCLDLCTRIRLHTTGFEPSALQVTELWVVRGDEAARFDEVLAEPDAAPLTVAGRHGPAVEPDGDVRVVARVRRSDGAERLVRSEPMGIQDRR